MQLKFLGHVMRKEGLENLILIGQIDGQGKAMHDILNRLKQVDGGTGSGRDNLRT